MGIRANDFMKKKSQITDSIEVSSYVCNYENLSNEAIDIYKEIITSINQVIEGYSYFVLIKGKPGLGKSWVIKDCLDKIEHVEISGDITPAYMYRALYESNGKIIWIKDVSKILKNESSIGFLKLATETHSKRILTKSNYSKVQEDLPNSFEYTGAIIADYNSVHSLPKAYQEDFDALKSRANYVELTLNFKQVERLLYSIAKLDWQKQVTKFLIDNFPKDELYLLNLRNQYRAFKLYEYAVSNKVDWKELVIKDIKQNRSDTNRLLYSLIGEEEVNTADLKRLLIKHKVVNSLSTARRKVIEWLELGELVKITEGNNNFKVRIGN